MPTIKLRYLNHRGTAELIRLALAQADVEYEDIRFDAEQWQATEKTNAPGGKCPYLEIDGKKLGQSMACARYIAREHGLMGKDSWEEAKVNEVTDTLEDVIMTYGQIFFGQTDEIKAEAKAKIPSLLAVLEGQLKSHDEGQGFFVGDTVTLADLKAFSTLEMVQGPPGEGYLDQFPLLKAHSDRVALLERIQAWLKKRPVTER